MRLPYYLSQLHCWLVGYGPCSLFDFSSLGIPNLMSERRFHSRSKVGIDSKVVSSETDGRAGFQRGAQTLGEVALGLLCEFFVA